MVGRWLKHFLGRAEFLQLLTHQMQIIGCGDNRKKQNAQAGERKRKPQRLRLATMTNPEGERQPYQQKPAQVQQYFQGLFPS